MTYRVLATDYDGTLAREGRVDERMLHALGEARAANLRLVMVTGREVADLFNIFPYPELFDRIVAENGAVLFDPCTGVIELLASPPPPALLAALAKSEVPVSVGHSIIATVRAHEHQVRSAIDDLNLEWHVILNKRSVMALPADVTKATGLVRALGALGVEPAETVGVGDAENDQAFLQMCGVAVAVANALPAVKEMSHLVTSGACGEGVTELIGLILSGELAARGGARVEPPRRPPPPE